MNSLKRAISERNTILLAELVTQQWTVEEANRALTLAASLGIKRGVELLIPISNPSLDQSQALFQATYQRNKECAQLLLPYCNPQHDHSKILYHAFRHEFYHGGWEEIIAQLWPISDKRHVLQQRSIDDVNDFIRQNIALKEKQFLEQELPQSKASSVKKKI